MRSSQSILENQVKPTEHQVLFVTKSTTFLLFRFSLIFKERRKEMEQEKKRMQVRNAL